MNDEDINTLKVKLISYTDLGFKDVFGYQQAIVIRLDVEKSKNLNLGEEDWIFISIKNEIGDESDEYKTVFFNNNNKKKEFSSPRSSDYFYKYVLEKSYDLDILNIDIQANRFLSQCFKTISNRLKQKQMGNNQYILLRLISQDLKQKDFDTLVDDKTLLASILIGDLVKIKN